MGRVSGRWVGILIAVLVVGVFAFLLRGGPQPAVNPVLAPADPTATPVTQTVPGMSPATMFGLLLKVGIVAALLGGSLWLLRRYAGSAGRNRGRTGTIGIVDTITLAQGRALYVLDLGDRAAVVGATPQQLTFLADVTDPEMLARLRTEPERPASPVGELSGRLGAFLQGMNAARAAAVAERQMAAQPSVEQGSGAVQAVRQPAGPSFQQTLHAYQTADAAAEPPYQSDDLGLGARPRRPTAPLESVSVPPDNDERLRALADRLRAAR